MRFAHETHREGKCDAVGKGGFGSHSKLVCGGWGVGFGFVLFWLLIHEKLHSELIIGIPTVLPY